jgi:hypothetical protein
MNLQVEISYYINLLRLVRKPPFVWGLESSVLCLSSLGLDLAILRNTLLSWKLTACWNPTVLMPKCSTFPVILLLSLLCDLARMDASAIFASRI